MDSLPVSPTEEDCQELSNSVTWAWPSEGGIPFVSVSLSRGGVASLAVSLREGGVSYFPVKKDKMQLLLLRSSTVVWTWHDWPYVLHAHLFAQREAVGRHYLFQHKNYGCPLHAGQATSALTAYNINNTHSARTFNLQLAWKEKRVLRSDVIRSSKHTVATVTV